MGRRRSSVKRARSFGRYGRLSGLVPARPITRRSLLGLGVALGTSGCAWRDSVLFWPPKPSKLVSPQLIDVGTAHGRIYALYQPALAGRPTLVWFHGNGGDITYEQDLLRLFSRTGCGVFLAEYPGYAGLAGERVSVPRVVSRANAAVAYLQDELGCAPRSTVVGGYSLGAAVAAQVVLSRPAAALVLCAPFTSFLRIARHHAGALADVVVQEGLDTVRIAPLLTLPTLLVHGAKDSLAPVQMSAEIAARAPHARRLVISSAAHNDLLGAEGDLVVRIVTAFVRDRFAGVEALGLPLEPISGSSADAAVGASALGASAGVASGAASSSSR